MKTNPYRLFWLSLVGVLLILLAALIGWFAVKESSEDFTPEQKTVPDYQKTALPGEIVTQFRGDGSALDIKSSLPTPDALPIDQSLLDYEAPLAGTAIKAPEEPALPPSQDQITRLVFEEGNLLPNELSFSISEGIILEVEAIDDDCYFVIDGLGINDQINLGDKMSFSFRAPAKPSQLSYYCLDSVSGEKLGKGVMKTDN